MIIVVMGVAGSGKSTVGRLLAEQLKWPYYDGDEYHPPSNLAKMSAGEPLTDDDRWVWLERIREIISESSRLGQDAVIACSALRQAYREHLQLGNDDVTYVYLKGDSSVFRTRLTNRAGHFMRPDMLDSQLRTLEEPEGVLAVDATAEPKAIVAEVKKALAL